MAKVVKNELLQLVPKLSELHLLDLCESENLQLTKTKKDRKSALGNLLIRHVTSEEVEDTDDEGLAVFQRLLDQMKDMLKDDDDEVAKQMKLAEDEEAKAKMLELDMEEKLNALKSTVNDLESGLGGSSDQAGGGLGGLAFGKSSGVNFEALLEKIVSDQVSKSLYPSTAGKSGSKLFGGGLSGFRSGGLAGNQTLDEEDSLEEERERERERERAKATTTTTTTEFHKLKLREFKISNGTVGVEGSLDYSDLLMQMKEGLSSGYSEQEVMSGVIRATKPGTELRKYLVRHQSMTYDDFKQTLRSFYNVRESQTIMDEMRDMVQGEDQPLLKYVMGMCALRDEVYEVSLSEDCPPGDALVKKRFVDSCLSGLRIPTVRLEMQALLKQDLSDPKLFEEVNQIMKRVKDNEMKVGGEVKSAEVKSMNVGGKKQAKKQDDGWREETASKLDALATQVSKLEAVISKVAVGDVPSSKMSNSEMEAKMASLLGTVQHLAVQMQEYQQGGDSQRYGGSSKFKFKKCDDCERDRKFCKHCRKCKQEGHKFADCPEN